MATIYVDTSAIFNGNGTASTQAASAGAAGASNSLLTLLGATHPYITVGAGDNIYIRTHTGTVDCEETMAASITSGNIQDKDNPVLMYFDDGTVWGNSGQFKLKISAAGEYNLDLGGWIANIYAGDANDRRLSIISQNTATNGTQPYFEFPGGFSSGIDISSIGGFRLATTGTPTLGNHTIIKDLRFALINGWYSTSNYPFVLNAFTTSCTFINPIFDLTGVVTLIDSSLIHCAGGQGNYLQIFGGKVIGGHATLSILKVEITPTRYVLARIEGFDLGSSGVTILPLGTIDDYSVLSQNANVAAIGCGNPYNCEMMTGPAFVQFKNIGTYPTLNATLPDGNNTPWSYKVYPKGTRENAVAQLPQVEKLFTATSAAKTFTMEVLIQDTLIANTRNLYLVAQYVDNATGDVVVLSTFNEDGSALTPSTAGWTNTTYGDNVYKKYKLSVVTPSTIKQGTVIRAILFCGIKRVNANDIFFYDPDLMVS